MTRLALLVLLLLPAFVPAAESTSVEGRVSAVTVYQGQALVTREIELPEADGLMEVVVTNLPSAVLPASLYAEPADGVQVRSVSYRVRPVEQDIREEVRELDTKIQTLQDELAASQREKQVLAQRTAYVDKLEAFTAGTATTELKSGVLNAETLMQLSKYIGDERTTIAKAELALGIKERQLNSQLELLNRQRGELTSGSAKTVREAVVFLNAEKAGPAALRLSYLVSNASWSPSYNIRATTDNEEISVEYNASVQQMSGENWNDVQMTLSTATPSLVAKAPTLEALPIVLRAPVQQQPVAYAEQKRRLSSQQKGLADNRGNFAMNAPNSPAGTPQTAAPQSDSASEDLFGMSGGGGGFGGGEESMPMRSGSFGSVFVGQELAQTDKLLNSLACADQLLDFNADRSQIFGRTSVPSLSEGVSISYKLASATSLPSRSDRQLIQIALMPLKGEFYRLGSPVLTSFVYREARLTNDSDQVLLAGPAATFLGGQFVGRGEVPTVAVGESFTVGLGIDESLRVARELVKKETRVQGGNRIDDFEYRLAIENFGDKPATVRLVDRMPKTAGADIKITLVKSDKPVSDDELYQRTDRKQGLLRWDLESPAASIGAKRTELSYTMQIEYDRQLSIAGATE